MSALPTVRCGGCGQHVIIAVAASGLGMPVDPAPADPLPSGNLRLIPSAAGHIHAHVVDCGDLEVAARRAGIPPTTYRTHACEGAQ